MPEASISGVVVTAEVVGPGRGEGSAPISRPCASRHAAIATALGSVDDLRAAQSPRDRDPGADILPMQRQRLTGTAASHLHQADQKSVAHRRPNLVGADAARANEALEAHALDYDRARRAAGDGALPMASREGPRGSR